jgi:hypothetical protein
VGRQELLAVRAARMCVCVGGGGGPRGGADREGDAEAEPLDGDVWCYD